MGLFRVRCRKGDATDEGCRAFINGTSATNILPNGDFESYDGTIDDAAAETKVTGWNGSLEAVSSDLNIGGTVVGVVLPAAGEVSFVHEPARGGIDTGRPLAAQTLTFSFYGRSRGAGCSANFGLRAPNSSVVLDPANSPTNVALATATYTTDWTRFVQTIRTPAPATAADYDNTVSKHIVQPFIAGAGCDVVIDNAQLEVGDLETSFAGYGGASSVHLNKSRQSCSSIDVGCTQYTAVDVNETINGVVNWTDRCSADVAGCRAYRKEPILNVPTRPFEDPVNVIPSSGRTCQASDVGCEEYTNLDVASSGR